MGRRISNIALVPIFITSIGTQVITTNILFVPLTRTNVLYYVIQGRTGIEGLKEGNAIALEHKNFTYSTIFGLALPMLLFRQTVPSFNCIGGLVSFFIVDPHAIYYIIL
uniref:Uncharacterized protein n=1 Tax=Timema shepardi TaxID=629360 RepID=A0A7R9AT26_TIMSH|nr:unnamed protein product [Timema shepardi]